MCLSVVLLCPTIPFPAYVESRAIVPYLALPVNHGDAAPLAAVGIVPASFLLTRIAYQQIKVAHFTIGRCNITLSQIPPVTRNNAKGGSSRPSHGAPRRPSSE
jgi:hypothetical protein